MNYVMSDLHGCYDEFINMLELIDFSADDNLIIVGDVVDRGASSIILLQDLMKRNNIHLLMGNHDFIMTRVINSIPIDVTADNFSEYLSEDIVTPPTSSLADYNFWMDNGGKSTFNQYLNLPPHERNDMKNFLSNLMYYYELIIENQKFMLVHSIPKGFLKEKPIQSYSPIDLLFYRIQNDKWDEYFYDDKILIVGHTPTFFIHNECAGKIYKREKIINIDCGCTYRSDGGRLCCLKLDDMNEYYI